MENTIKIKQNLDTNFLKFIAIISMTVDHFYKVFLPGNMIFGIIGRIAFPLFAYCVTVGCLYTRDVKKYLLRLFVFAVISQPFYTLAFHPTWERFWREILTVNILFSLITGVLAVNALMNIKKNWWMLSVVVAMEVYIGLDYGFYGIGLMMIFYLCRNNSLLSAAVAAFWILSNGLFGDFMVIGGIGLDKQVFALLALPLIYIHTDFNPKLHKYFFYIFYPAHLLALFLTRTALGV